jgi:hypothetical protein
MAWRCSRRGAMCLGHMRPRKLRLPLLLKVCGASPFSQLSPYISADVLRFQSLSRPTRLARHTSATLGHPPKSSCSATRRSRTTRTVSTTTSTTVATSKAVQVNRSVFLRGAGWKENVKIIRLSFLFRHGRPRPVDDDEACQPAPIPYDFFLRGQDRALYRTLLLPSDQTRVRQASGNAAGPLARGRCDKGRRG